MSNRDKKADVKITKSCNLQSRCDMNKNVDVSVIKELGFLTSSTEAKETTKQENNVGSDPERVNR